MKCEHIYIFLESTKDIESTGYQSLWKKTDRFYCQKCLEYKDKSREEYSRDRPSWY